MKKRKKIVLMVTLFAGTIILSSCQSQGQCPGVYSKVDEAQKQEQKS
ncbi:MAG: hypothetical protein K9H84_03755 [Bacteroidales bacterium]|nr:hypothetical protein [Bacteroidales bacterium]